jgi:hypothetical protein
VKKALEARIDELYRLPLDEFTKARNAMARELSAGDRTQVVSLVKPSLPMWVTNQLYWRDMPTYKALIDASEGLRAAHRSALSGRKADTHKAGQLHRATVERAFASALAIAQKSGARLTDAVRDTVRRTLEALPGDEPAGRLTRAPAAAGFSLLTGLKLRPIAEPAVPASPAAPRGRHAGPSRDELRKQKLAALEKKKAELKARKEQERREREIRKAEQALRDAEFRLAELKR